MIVRCIATTLLAAGILAGCHKTPSEGTPPAAQAPAIPELAVPEVAKLVNAKSAVLVDANSADTRREYGIVPGALLLSGHEFALSELPAEKGEPLVFYCGGTACRASDKAAARAVSAGYQKVSVMREGIRGWKGAGQPTETPRS